MSSPSDLAALTSLAASGSEGFVPVAEEQRPHTFLSLAPAVSTPWKSPTLAPVVSKDAPVVTPLTAEQEELAKTRRSSSLSSDGSRKRFLKLAHSTVAGEGDWAEEEAVE